MCKLCDENRGESLSCFQCGTLICFDVGVPDDFGSKEILVPAGVDMHGHFICELCAEG